MKVVINFFLLWNRYSSTLKSKMAETFQGIYIFMFFALTFMNGNS